MAVLRVARIARSCISWVASFKSWYTKFSSSSKFVVYLRDKWSLSVGEGNHIPVRHVDDRLPILFNGADEGGELSVVFVTLRGGKA